MKLIFLAAAFFAINTTIAQALEQGNTKFLYLERHYDFIPLSQIESNEINVYLFQNNTFYINLRLEIQPSNHSVTAYELDKLFELRRIYKNVGVVDKTQSKRAGFKRSLAATVESHGSFTLRTRSGKSFKEVIKELSKETPTEVIVMRVPYKALPSQRR